MTSPRYVWKMDGNCDLTSGYNAAVWSKTGLTVDDAGVYACVVFDSYNEEKMVRTFEVKVPGWFKKCFRTTIINKKYTPFPDVSDEISKTGEILGQIGTELNIHCDVVIPTLDGTVFSQQVSWFFTSLKGGSPVPLKTGLSSRFKTEDVVFVQNGRLTVSNFSTDDVGTYTCHGVTAFGRNVMQETKVIVPGSSRLYLILLFDIM